MKRLESLEDEMRGTVTYDLGNGKYARYDVRAVLKYGIAELLRSEGYGHLVPTERLPVIHHEHRVGTMAADFDPASIKSNNYFYDPRPGDFRREGDTWVANRTLGPGDLDAVAGFQRERS